MSTKDNYCLNCNNRLTDNFCSKCGQSAHTSRINLKYLIGELQYGLLHINKGLFYTTKELMLKPAVTIRSYLTGKRVRLSKPFLFLIIWGLIYSIVFHYFHYFPLEEMNKQVDRTILEYIPVYELFSSHYSLMVLFLIPFYAAFSYLLFRRYNYIEHLVVFSYINGVRIVILLLFYPLIYLSEVFRVYQMVNILAELYVIWAISSFFKASSWFVTIGKTLLVIILAFLSLVIAVTITFEVLKSWSIRL